MKFKFKALTIASLLTVSAFSLGGNTTQTVIEKYDATTKPPVQQKDFYEFFQVPVGQRFQLATRGLVDQNEIYYLDASGDSVYTRFPSGQGASLNGSKWVYWTKSSELSENNKGFSLGSQTTSTITQRYPGNPVSTEYSYSTLQSYNGKGLQYQTTIATSGANEVLRQEIVWTNQETAFTTNPASNQQMTSVPLTRLVFDADTGSIELFQYHSKNGNVQGADFVIVSPETVGSSIFVNSLGQQVQEAGTNVKQQWKIETAEALTHAPAELFVDFGTKVAYPKTVSTTTPITTIDSTGGIKVSITLDEAATLPSAPTLVNAAGVVAQGTAFAADPLINGRAIKTYSSLISTTELDNVKPANGTSEDLRLFIDNYTINNVELTSSSTGTLTTKVLGSQSGFGSNSSSTMSAGAITGIVIGSIAAVALAGWFVSSRRKGKLK